MKACLLATSAMVVLGLAAEPVIRTDYPLTARPWKPLNTSQERYLDAIEGICRFSIRHQDASGAIIDPILKRKQLYRSNFGGRFRQGDRPRWRWQGGCHLRRTVRLPDSIKRWTANRDRDRQRCGSSHSRKESTSFAASTSVLVTELTETFPEMLHSAVVHRVPSTRPFSLWP